MMPVLRMEKMADKAVQMVDVLQYFPSLMVRSGNNQRSTTVES